MEINILLICALIVMVMLSVMTTLDMKVFAKNSDLLMEIYRSLDQSALDLAIEAARLTQENENLKERVDLLEAAVYNKV